jgi:DNA-binding response OmpR family regulator
MKLLVIEDERDLLAAVTRGLKKKGYAIDCASDGEEGLYLIEVNRYDLVVLDLNLPKLDGLRVLEEIRKKDKELRVLILSARSSVEERVEGLDTGANDYLIKPFHFDELDARIRNLLRRSFIQENVCLQCGGVTVDTAARIAYEGGSVLTLTKTELAILEYLILHKGIPVSTEQLMEHVFDSDSDPFSNTIKVHIYSLRRKMKHTLIQNIRGQGYRIIDREEKTV